MLKCSLARRAGQFLLVLAAVGCLCRGQAALAQVTAKTLIGKAVSDDKEYAEIDNAIARFSDRDIDGCRAILERARNNNAKLPPPGVMMAMLWLSVNQLAPARAELEQTVVKFPNDPEPFLMLADLAFQDRRVTDSSVLFDRATQLTGSYAENPKRKRDFEIRCNAGTAAVAEARRQWDAAQKHLTTWIGLDPDNAGAHFRLGNVLFHMGKESEAIEQFREARKLDAKALQPELALARLYDEDGKKDVAKKWIEAAMSSSPQDSAVLLAAAQWYLGQNDIKTAESISEKALSTDAKSLEAKIVRGVVARVARDYATAENRRATRWRWC